MEDMVLWAEHFLKDVAINYNLRASNIAAKQTSPSRSLGKIINYLFCYFV